MEDESIESVNIGDDEGDGGSGLDITLGKVISYPVGIFLLFVGLGTMVLDVIAGLILFLGGLLALPVVRSKLEESQGISLSRWVTVVIVVVLVITGGWAMGDVPDSDTSPTMGSDGGSDGGDGVSTGGGDGGSGPTEADVIRGPPESLLPTIDDFGTGWRLLDDEASNQTGFFNVETETSIQYSIVVHDSVSEARTDFRSRVRTVEDQGIGKESINIGDEAILYKLDRDYIVIEFRERNVVAREDFLAGGGVLTPETNAVKYARVLHDSITG